MADFGIEDLSLTDKDHNVAFKVCIYIVNYSKLP